MASDDVEIKIRLDELPFPVLLFHGKKFVAAQVKVAEHHNRPRESSEGYTAGDRLRIEVQGFFEEML